MGSESCCSMDCCGMSKTVESIRQHIDDPFMLGILFSLASMLTLLIASLNISSLILRVAIIGLSIPLILRATSYIARMPIMPVHLDNDSPLLKGKTIVITGANCGIGYATVQQLILWRASRIILACRDKSKLDGAIRALEIWKSEMGQSAVGKGDHYMTTLEGVVMDLSDLASVKTSAEEIETLGVQIDILINNAGVMMCPYSKTKQGHEMHWGTNHLGHFLLTKLLLPNVERNSGRIVNLSSLGHSFAPVAGFSSWEKVAAVSENDYNKAQQYGWSKLANIYFTRRLQQKLTDLNSKVVVVAVHPGGVRTQLGRHMPPLLAGLVGGVSRTPKMGAATTLVCCVEKSTDLVPGGYYANCRSKEPMTFAKDAKIAEMLWATSEELVKDFI